MSKYRINWSKHPDLLEWKKVADEKQKFYYEYLGKRKWELYGPNDLRYLKLKIGYALFGPPLNLQEKDVERTYREPNYRKKIDYIMSAIKKLNISTVLYVGFIYFIAIVENKYTEFPIIRVLKKRDEGKDICFYIDPLGYSYKSWEKFLYTNVMPSCIYCYPINGFYTCSDLGQLELDYSYSPQSYSIFSKGLGVVSAVGSAVTGVLPGGSSEAVKAIPAESIVRGVANEAKKCWITVGSVDSCSSLYAVHSTRSLVASSHEFDRITHFLAKILEIGPMRSNWFAVLNMIPEIIRNANKVNYTHIAQFFVSVLFFCHTVISYDTIKHILKETLNDMSEGKKVHINYRQMLFLEEVKDKLGEKGDDEVVGLIKQINCREKLLEEIVDNSSTKDMEEGGNYSIENLLQVLKVVNKTGNRLEIITNYCLFLEEVVKSCKNCSEKIKEAKRYTNFKEDILVNDNDLSEAMSDLELNKLQIEVDTLNTSELENYLIEKTIKVTPAMSVDDLNNEASDFNLSKHRSESDSIKASDLEGSQNENKKVTQVKDDLNNVTLDLKLSQLQIEFDSIKATDIKSSQNEKYKVTRVNDNELDNGASDLNLSKLYSYNDSDPLSATDLESSWNEKYKFTPVKDNELDNGASRLNLSKLYTYSDSDPLSATDLETSQNEKYKFTQINDNGLDNRATDLNSSKLFSDSDCHNATELKSHKFIKYNKDISEMSANNCESNDEPNLKLSKHHIEFDPLSIGELESYQIINYNIVTPEMFVNCNEFDDGSSNLKLSELAIQTDSLNTSELESNRFEKYEEVTPEMAGNDNNLDYGASDFDSFRVDNEIDSLYSTDFKTLEKSKKNMLQQENVIEIINENPEENSDVIQQGTTQVYSEFVEEGLEPLGYYNRFVDKAINVCEPTYFYNDTNDVNTWLFILSEEKCGLKLVKIKIRNGNNNLQHIEVSYY